jgi:hypothetical protein
MRDSRIVRASIAAAILLISLHTTAAANADSPTAGYCSVVNALDGKTEGGGKLPMGDDIAAITIALSAINGVLHGYYAVDSYRYVAKVAAENTTQAAEALKPFSQFLGAVGTFIKSFIPFSENIAKPWACPSQS